MMLSRTQAQGRLMAMSRFPIHILGGRSHHGSTA